MINDKTLKNKPKENKKKTKMVPNNRIFTTASESLQQKSINVENSDLDPS
jgi:hypothetical protein